MVKKFRPEENRLGVGGGIALIIAIALVLFPIYWLFNTSIKPYQEWIPYPPVFIPSRLAWENWMILIDPQLTTRMLKLGGQAGIGEVMGPVAISGIFSITSSAICAGLGTALSIVVGLLAAFAVSRHNFGGSFFPMFVLSLRMFPPVVVMVPLLVMYSTIGMYDTHLGLILAYAVLTSPFSLWMIKSFIDDVPKELEEAAMTDGLSALSSHFRVTFPLIKGGIAATALFVFILNWSEFMLALTLGHENVVTLPVAMARYTTEMGTLYGPISALALVAVAVVIVFAYVIRRFLVVGMTFGAIKR